MIHKFEFEDSKIVVDVNSGSIHVVDELIWQLLDCYTQGKQLAVEQLKDKFTIQDINEGWEEIETLVAEDQLFAHDYYQDNYKMPDSVVKSLCLHVAHDCNLRCNYCFAATGDFGLGRKLMDFETGQKAIDFLIEASGARKHLEIDFFGGEPMLNFEVVKELVQYGKQVSQANDKVIQFTLTTNATLLDEKSINWLKANNVLIVLSLDGRKEVNDNMRVYADGSGSYDEIVPNITEIIKAYENKGYYVRGTYTGENLDFSKDVIHMVDVGYDIVSVEPAVVPENESYAITERHLPAIKEEYKQLTKEYLSRYEQGKAFEFFHFNLDLSGGPCLPKRLTGCGAGREYVAVSPEGEYYPCHQFVGKDEFKIGSVDTGLTNPKLQEEFKNAHVYNKEACRSCWAKFYCSGGCHANAESQNGSIYEPYHVGCELQKMRLECAIYIQLKKAKLV